MDKVEFRKQLIELIKEQTSIGTDLEDYNFMIGKDGIFVRLQLRISHFRNGDEVKKMFIGEKYMALVYGDGTDVYTIDTQIISDCIKERDEDVIAFLDGDLNAVPWSTVKIEYNNIKCIYEEHNNLMIVDKEGNKTCKGPKDFENMLG